MTPGTLCYFVNLADAECVDFNGRVVEVVATNVPDECEGIWHHVKAAWLHAYFDDREVHVQPRNLRPIAGPGGVEKNHRGREAGTAGQPHFHAPGMNFRGGSRARTA